MANKFRFVRGSIGFAALTVLLTVVLTGCLGGLFSRTPPVPKVGDLRGVVLYENKEPVEGAVVTISELDFSVTTDAEGSFVFEELDHGSYTLEVSKPGHTSLSEPVQLKDSELSVEIYLPPQGSMLLNGSFNVDREPRQNPQGFGNEMFYGWRPFGIVGPNTEIEHVKIVDRPDTESGTALRLLGHETGYVGVRSIHMPVEPGKDYTLSVKAYIEELLEVNRFQAWIEWWPAGLTGEPTSERLGTPRVYGANLGQWDALSTTQRAPENANTATILIIIHVQGELPKLPAEIYVTDVRFGPAELQGS